MPVGCNIKELDGRIKIMANLKKKKISTKSLVGTAFVVLAIIAVAYWVFSGNGSKHIAAKRNRASIKIAQTEMITDLNSKSQVADVILGTLTVVNGDKAYVHQITTTIKGTSNPGCTASDFIIIQPPPYDKEVYGLAAGVPLGSIAFNSTDKDQSACQGETVNLSFTSN